ncbi:unnamed protein product [Clonostachys solani]|uniref:Uncharacterized protein n=1 Tax=Clonostachys solani TaxID=160281 RepID=A0A9P0E823_9HYPO|nr:unnamed protein product [Clonostachys solani]
MLRRTTRRTAGASPASEAPASDAPASDAPPNALSGGAISSSSSSGLKRRRDAGSPDPKPAPKEDDKEDGVIVVDMAGRQPRPRPQLPLSGSSAMFVKKEDQDELSRRPTTPPISSRSKKRARFSSPVSFSTPPNAEDEPRDAISSPPRKRLRRLGPPRPWASDRLADPTGAGNEPSPTKPELTPPRLWFNCISKKQKRLAEKNSINELVQQKGWNKTLCIDPLLWTRAQCRLLRCLFKYDEDAQQRFPEGWYEDHSLSKVDAFKMHVDVCSPLRTREVKLEALMRVLRDNDFEVLGNSHDMPKNIWVSPFRRDLNFIYHGKSYAEVAADAIFSHTAGKEIHSLAYVDLDYARANRRLALSLAPPSFRDGQHPSAFVGREQPAPKTLRHDAQDPYIVGVMIALAQKQREDEVRKSQRQRDAATQSEPSSSEVGTNAKLAKPQVDETDACYKVSVVAIPEKADYMYFYTASFPFKFLQKLYRPSEYSASDWVPIRYFQAPLRKKLNILEMLTPTMKKIVGEERTSL